MARPANLPNQALAEGGAADVAATVAPDAVLSGSGPGSPSVVKKSSLRAKIAEAHALEAQREKETKEREAREKVRLLFYSLCNSVGCCFALCLTPLCSDDG